jgi:hypothetical protein
LFSWIFLLTSVESKRRASFCLASLSDFFLNKWKVFLRQDDWTTLASFLSKYLSFALSAMDPIAEMYKFYWTFFLASKAALISR